MCVCVCVYLPYLPIPVREQDVTQGHILKSEFNGLEFRVFLLFDWLPYQG